MLDKFKEFVHQKTGLNETQLQVSRLRCILEAENTDVCDVLNKARYLMLIGFLPTGTMRPTVFDVRKNDGNVCWFVDTDLSQDIITLQDEIDIAASKKQLPRFLAIQSNLEVSFTTNVYGKGVMKGNTLVPQLTIAEVITQVGGNEGHEMLAFNITSGAREDEFLTAFGYHSYEVTVYNAEYPDGAIRMRPTLLGYTMEDVDMI